MGYILGSLSGRRLHCIFRIPPDNCPGLEYLLQWFLWNYHFKHIDFAGGGGTLEYCDIQYGTEAVNIDSIAAITINENKITNNVIGINGTHPSISFTNNNISNNSLSGIIIEGPSSGLTFSATGNTILGNQAGITLESQIGDITATITGNEIADSVYDGI